MQFWTHSLLYAADTLAQFFFANYYIDIITFQVKIKLGKPINLYQRNLRYIVTLKSIIWSSITARYMLLLFCQN